METLRKKEKRDLLEKLTPVVGRAIEIFGAEKLWTDLEIARATEIPQNRLAEYKNFRKYGRTISEKHLLALIGKGIVTVQALKEMPGLTEREQEFLDGLGSVESETLRLKILKV